MKRCACNFLRCVGPTFIRTVFLVAAVPVRRLSRKSWRLLMAMYVSQLFLLLCSGLFEILEFVIKAHSASTFRSLQKVLGEAKKTRAD